MTTPARPARRWFEGPLWLAAGGLLAALLTWPLAAHLTSRIPNDAADPLAEAWEAAWVGHAVLTQPLSVFSANAFWPEGPSLAFSDSLLGYFPAGLVGSGPVAAITRYNLLFLFAYALAFAGAALLAREIGARPIAAAVAGAAFAWAPWRMPQNGHLNILSTGAIPLALCLLLSGYRRQRTGQIVAGWLVAGWQISLGFGLGIYFFYLLALLAAICAAEWLRRGRPRPQRPVVVGTLVGGSAFLLIVAVCVAPYLQVLAKYPDAPRSRAEVAFFSPPLRSFLAADAQNRVWGQATAAVRKSLPWPPEQELFPGLSIVLLAGVGLVRRRSSVRLRVALALSVVVGVVLALGLRLHGGLYPYGLLYDLLPGWQGLRTPGRLSVFWSLALALLAALGTQRIAEAVAGRLRSRPDRAAIAGSAALVCAAVVLWESAPRLPLAAVPLPPPGLSAVAAPQVHFPASAFNDFVYMLWSTDGFPNMANGSTSYLPPGLNKVRELTGFPDPASVLFLRSRGYRSVLLHTDRVAGTPWAGAAGKPVTGLGVSVRQIGPVIVYDLSPP